MTMNSRWLYLGFGTMIVLGTILVAVGLAAGQDHDGDDFSWANTTEVGTIDNVEAGWLCTVAPGNNESVYGDEFDDNGNLIAPGNILIVATGKGVVVLTEPIERVAGPEPIIEFVAPGGDLTVSIAWNVHTSEDSVPVTCVEPPPEGTTTTTQPPVESTTTTSTTMTPTTTTQPPTACKPDDPACLAITGSPWTEILVAGALAMIGIGLAAKIHDGL